ncbi:RNA polymerase sigma factor [Humisphaera borealis]|uniref:RNA polymerase sigma factor n=1 Tax=Humisphaera borealis TaxID=2807512 RepID=A0A7M2WW56_9BACT|nr:sigma-70 family RNA polymerase sigma factor [Humisphaera borealis]QOV89787.1 sigma-70 family RNA polymerase sigma factor [Humisphaera borealis]
MKLATTNTVATERFYALVWPHLQNVLRTAKLICRDEVEAEDLAQETMLKAYRRIDCLREDDRVRPWLMAILRNTHIDRTRVHKHHELSLDEMEWDPAEADEQCWTEPKDCWDDPDSAIDGFSDSHVITAIKKLPRDIRWTLLLVDVEGMQDAEAAKVLDVPVGTVKSRLHRGRHMLRATLYPLARDLHLAV